MLRIILICFVSIYSGILLAQCPVIPTPVVYKKVEGSLPLGNTLSVNTSALPEEIKAYLIDRLVNDFKIRVVFTNSAKQLSFKKLVNVPEDSYSINVNEGISVEYSSERSCFYAVVSLLQMIQGDEPEYFIEKCFIQDQPKFQWRGLHLDVSRHFFTVDEVKRYIDLMALYKFNTFHWHLTDDQGWRIEIKKYPKLTEVGAWRDSTVNDHYSASPRTYTVEKYGGYYTQEEIKEVVEFAKSRYITVVPEIEMPGHARAALAAYPEYSCTMKAQEVPGLWGVFDDIFCAKEQTIDFLKEVLDEVLVLFPSEYIHIGGDEAPKTRWNKCPRCQAVIRENGLKDEHELQSFFIREMDEYLTSKGRKLIGWDEILEGGLSPNASVMSWRGEQGGIEAAKQNHFVVMSPGSHCYFDHYQSTNPNEPLAIGGYTPIEKVYQYNPIPKELTAQESYYILGAQANLWTEYIPDMDKLEYMTYPRALALAQVVWCPAKPEYSVFKESLVNYHLKFLKRFDVNYSNAMFYATMGLKPKMDGVNVHFKGSGETYKFDLFTRSDEKTQTMGGGQVVTQSDSLYFERTQGDKVVNYKFKLLTENVTDPAVFQLTTHPSLNLPVTLITQPNSRYPGEGGFTLVDGIIGSRPWKGNEWLGFDQQEIEFTVDLGKINQIQSFDISFLQEESSWIYYPGLVRISTSKNGKKWKYVKEADINFMTKDIKKGKHLPFGSIINRKGRYVKVLISTFDQIPEGQPGEGHVPWTFIDEIIIYH